jgi:hypothetical protein
LELFLYGDKDQIAEIFNFLEGGTTNHPAILTSSEFLEIYPLIIFVKHNKIQINEFYNALTNYYFAVGTFTRLKPKCLTTITVFLTKKILINGEETFVFLLSVWFVYTFANYNVLNSEVIEGELWINTHFIVNNILKTLSKFFIKLNLHFNLTGDDKLPIRDDKFEDVIVIALHTLINCKLLNKKLIKRCRGESKHKFKSENYINFESQFWKFNNTINLEIFLKPGTIKIINNKFYIFERHYMSIKPLIRKNPLNNKNSEITNINFIKLKTNMRLYMRWDFLEKASALVFNHYGYNKNITQKDFYQLLVEKQKTFWKKSSQRELSQLFSLNYFLNIKPLKAILQNGFYFHYYLDFRGRLYADSPVAYTHNRLFRYFYYYGEYSEQEKLFYRNNFCKDFLKKINTILKKTNIKSQYPNINYNDPVANYFLIIIFFEIGKIFKKYFIEECGGMLTFEDIQMIGIKYFNNPELSKNSGLYSNIEYMSLIFMLSDLNDGKYYKYPIFKDATASGLQILAMLLGGANLNTYTKTNFLEKNIWYDTYHYIIQNFISVNNIPANLVHYFNRSNLKRTIMTYNYQATLITCWSYFKEDSNLPWNFNDPLNKEIWPYFLKFYQFLQKLFDGCGFYFNPSTSIINFYKNKFKNNLEFVCETQDDFKMLLIYFALINGRRIDVTAPGINKQRITYLCKTLSEKPDSTKTFTALKANITHFFDAYIIRYIILKINRPIITIHDSIGIDILSVSIFEDAAKEAFQALYDHDPFKLNKKNNIIIKINSNFIFL